MREVASSDNSCANCHYDIYQDTFSTGVIGFHGFILFSVSLIPVDHHRIWHFLVMGVKRRREGGRGLYASKERGDIKKGG